MVAILDAIGDLDELCKLFRLNIPDRAEKAYYVSTLLRSPEHATLLPVRIAAYADLERFARESGFSSARRYKLDHALPTLTTAIETTEAYQRLLAEKPPAGGLRTKDELKRHAGALMLSIDVQSANFSALKTLDARNELGEDWPSFCARQGIHHALGLSKSFRQVVFGKTSPKRLTDRQHAAILRLAEALTADLMTLTDDEIVFISHDEVVLALRDSDGELDPAARAEAVLAALPSMSEVVGMPLHTTIYRLDRIKKPIYLKTVFELAEGELTRSYKALYGVPASKFYRYFKTHVLQEPLDDRDLLFVYDGELARWVVPRAGFR